jgi:hypothetical protein
MPTTHSFEVPLTLDTQYSRIEAYAEQDAILGSPNPRYKQSTIYSNKYLAVRLQLVDSEMLTDAELDLTIF